MSASRPYRLITTRLSTGLTFFENRKPANRAENQAFKHSPNNRANKMKPADVCIAILVAITWGFGFIASRLALNELSPELMTTLRFSIAALPCLFLRKPDVSWPVLIAISFSLFLGQFLVQAYAIAHGMPVGLSSVIVQSQALFTIAFAAVIFREIPTAMQGVGIAIATAGLLMICGTVGYDFSVG